MTASTIFQDAPIATSPSVENPTKFISWKEFEHKYLHREDGYKYEWVNGTIEKTKRSMDQKQLFILDNLRTLFERLKFECQLSGIFEAEIDTFFLEKTHRRPDISYFTPEQRIAIHQGIHEVPQFVIEVISSRDQMNLVHKKMGNYRAAKVQVVWHIFPLLEEVHVFYGDNLKQSAICQEEDICSAAPILPVFRISAKDIFSRNI